MDYMSNKALIIAVSLLITIGIASAVLYTINQVMGVYKTVYETDTLIQSNFDEFDEYDGAVKTKLDLLNAAKKYKNSDSVYVVTMSEGEVIGKNIDAIKSERFNVDSAIVALERDEQLNVNKDEEPGRVSVNTSEASIKYNTFVKEKDGKIIIGFSYKGK